MFDGRRVAALGRAECTLLWRNRTALVSAVLVPVVMVWSMRRAVGAVDPAKYGMSPNASAMCGGIGVVLLFALYAPLVTAFVARREDLVFKRLRTGEPTDAEILAATALPAVAVSLLQIAALLVAGASWLRLPVPHRPELLLAGVVSGVALLGVLAAASTAFTRTAELAQITTLPLALVSLAGSGMFVPLDAMPHGVAEVCRTLPVTPVVDLVRMGWLGGAPSGMVVRDLVTAVAWTALAGFAVRRWFRWEPRR
ncbi:ABC transporter permease [Streptantibioticus parmotrematis]|uniref:ABC transporter permease n=1 Tax=Streptantibioticus parmotrematis TaxID=2873249 RepID=UPI00340442FD